jgi:hypothetical protein
MNAPNLNPTARRTKRLGWIVTVLVICGFAYGLFKLTFLGEMIRAEIKNVPPAQLWADDLADDVRNKSRLASLQSWSTQTMARYQAGQLATNGKSIYGGPFAIRIAPQEIPDWLNNAWFGQKPEVSVLLNDESNMPECVIVGWYL